MKISCSALALRVTKNGSAEKNVFSFLKVSTASLTAWMIFDGLNEHDSVVTYPNKYLFVDENIDIDLQKWSLNAFFLERKLLRHTVCS